MRDIGDESSAGSTPPPAPSGLYSFSPSELFAAAEESPASPSPEALWSLLAEDGWCFNSDNQQPSLRPAASAPLRHTHARPPRPSFSKTNKRKHPMINHFECDDSVGNLDSFIGSIVSEFDKDEISSSDESEIQSDLPANEKRPPEIGMEFFSEEEAYAFYKKYANEVGFFVRRGKVQRLTTGAIRKRNFLCSSQGFKSMKASTNQATKYRRKETRTGCNASIQFTVEDGKWVVSNFISDHNHELDKAKKDHDTDVLDFQKTSTTHKDDHDEDVRVIEENGVEKLVNSLNGLPNGTWNMPQREDVQSLMNCFLKFQAKDPSFFYGIQVDAANCATNFFWTDCRSRVDYSYFTDVVVVDTTCRFDNLVCASFWGLNHHQQRMLFGCGLLLDETLESFVWLFRVFMVAMDNRPPETLYGTDEFEEIAKAIGTVFPKTVYRLGASNIYKNAKRHLSTYFEQHGFVDIFNKCIFDCQSKEEFESLWDSLLVQYNLRENSWLINVHSLWENWSHLSRRKIFSAGIEVLLERAEFDSISQNSENETMSLSGCFHRYVKEVHKLRKVELQEDLLGNENISVRSRKGMEKHAEELYTSAIFKKFQDEMLDSLSLAIEEATSSANISSFRLKEEGQNKEVIVTFDSSNSSVACSCGKFEQIGILCGHCLKVLNAKNIFQIPQQYILKRWKKSAKEVVNTKPASSYERNIMHKTLYIITKSIGIEESRNMVEGYLDLALKKAEEILKEKGTDQISSESLEIVEDTCCAIDGIRCLTNNKITSNSSCADQEEGSKNALKRTRKHKTRSNEIRESGCCSHDLVTESNIESNTLYESGGLTSSQFQVCNEISAPADILRSNNYTTQDSAHNQARQAESQATDTYAKIKVSVLAVE